jgi:uncharacterized OsmC-like protein
MIVAVLCQVEWSLRRAQDARAAVRAAAAISQGKRGALIDAGKPLGSCTSMTVHLYAAQKKWPLDQVVVRLSQERVHVRDCANCEDPGAMIHRIEKRIELIGSLDEAERVRLLEIADRCPVHRTLTSKIEIRSALVAASA